LTRKSGAVPSGCTANNTGVHASRRSSSVAFSGIEHAAALSLLSAIATTGAAHIPFGSPAVTGTSFTLG